MTTRLNNDGTPDKRYSRGGIYVGMSARSEPVGTDRRRGGKWDGKSSTRCHYNLTIDFDAKSVEGMGIDALTERIRTILVGRLGTFGGDIVKLRLKGGK